MTPLHVMIAERVAQHLGRPYGHGLYLTQVDSPKHRHYAARLAAASLASSFQVAPMPVVSGRFRQWQWVRQLAAMRRRLAQQYAAPAFGEVFVPSSIDRALLAMLTILSPRKLTTYDDGFVNVDPHPPKDFDFTGWKSRLVLLLSGITWWAERVRARSWRHFTVYGQPNIAHRTEYLPLGARQADGQVPLEGSALAANDASDPVVLFLGPFPEADAAVLHAFDQMATRLRPIGYLPHPRDASGLLKNAVRIDSLLVAEDFVLNLSRQSPQRAVHVYGYRSSGLVNLAAIQGVQAHAFVSAGTEPTAGETIMHRMGVVLTPF